MQQKDSTPLLPAAAQNVRAPGWAAYVAGTCSSLRRHFTTRLSYVLPPRVQLRWNTKHANPTPNPGSKNKVLPFTNNPRSVLSFALEEW